MAKKYMIFKYAGIASIAAYIVFTFISHLYNLDIQPLKNWLSDYGSPILNPAGAVFYAIGCILVAILLLVFYLGMLGWYRGAAVKRKFKIAFAIAQISGLLSSILMILLAIFNIGTHAQVHGTLSKFNMISINFFLCFTATGFLMNRDIPKYIGILGFAAAFFNIITTNAFTNLYVAEWIYYLCFIAYVVFITLQYDKLSGLPIQIEPPTKE